MKHSSLFDCEIFLFPVAVLIPPNSSTTATTSVTRFCEIPPLWEIFNNLWQYILGLFGFGQSSQLFWHNLYAFLAIFFALNGQILKTQSGHMVTLATTEKEILVLFLH